MQPIVTDQVAWSVGQSVLVCRSVCHTLTASEVTTLWRYKNECIIIIIITSEPCKNGCTD